jgi:transcriptional regulator with GAF, ATPase, and Fis domain
MAVVRTDAPGGLTAPLIYTETNGELVARRWKIEVTGGPDAGKTLVRDSGSVVVGTHPDADLVLKDDAVSRYHLELKLLAEGVLVVDLGSTNGTKVGGVRVDRALVQAGGSVRVGHTQLVLTPDDDRIVVDESNTGRFGEFVTSSPLLQKVLARLQIVARTEATVLIEGETGTGKELLARAIHDTSARKDGPFVVVDCGAVNHGVLESQLFGHVKGAFTSAMQDRVGAFEAGSKGTVFLDELGELPIDLQPKLLRVLEARTVQRVGESVERPVDIRFVAATNRDLESMLRDRRFRDDLYYRVAVVRAKVPPLRDRPEDIPLLAQHYARKLGGESSVLTKEVLAVLQSYDWPGNGREMRNVIERAVALSQGGRISPTELFPDEATHDRASFHDAKDQVIAEFENRYVRGLIARHHNNVSAAAREAGLSRTALYALMKRAGIKIEEER